MSTVLIAGIGMTPFGRFAGEGIRSLAVQAIDAALADAGVPADHVSKVFFGNAVAGVVTHQEMIRGQVALRNHPLARKSIINIENACASGGSALNLGFEAILGGRAEVVMVVGAEQLNHVDRARPFAALRASTDIEDIGESLEPGQIATNSILMDFYAGVARKYLERYQATPADFALVAVKNRRHASMNPLAHFRKLQSVEDVMHSRMIVDPLRLAMCAPTTDGAAALLLCSSEYARRLSRKAVQLVTTHVSSSLELGESPVSPAARSAYEASGIGPQGFDLIELHDAAAPAELLQYGEIGLCEPGEAHHWVRAGKTDLGGQIPVNTSGGLLSRGHPLGATGCAQVVELCQQLRGEAGARQVADARVGLAINGGGWLNDTYAVAVSTVVKRLD